MTDSLLYNVPLALVDAYRGRHLVVRSRDPDLISAALSTKDCDDLAYVQILGLSAPVDGLLRWECGTPLDLVVEKPTEELPLLYKYSPLLTDRPIRVSVPFAPGFGKVVRLAISLDFAVKLEGSQPAHSLAEELLGVASDYLYRPSVSVPVEFFHSLFLAFFRQEPVSLWAVQEEDPRRIRYVTDQNEETVGKRFIGMAPPSDFNEFVSAQIAGLITEGGECRGCEFVDSCSGYFKWPARNYRCDTVKVLFRTLAEAARELRSDLAACPTNGTGAA